MDRTKIRHTRTRWRRWDSRLSGSTVLLKHLEGLCWLFVSLTLCPSSLCLTLLYPLCFDLMPFLASRPRHTTPTVHTHQQSWVSHSHWSTPLSPRAQSLSFPRSECEEYDMIPLGTPRSVCLDDTAVCMVVVASPLRSRRCLLLGLVGAGTRRIGRRCATGLSFRSLLSMLNASRVHLCRTCTQHSCFTRYEGKMSAFEA
ncbi:hypothetical protein BC629DRAFT_1183922 [Irpex lacteus]|nr:hypothetical protein BC629DRAFT_1183922 [Irpex lacteus]